ncbi:SLC13 family permease [Halobellus captivus]|uniref:SLC13 family permease n=1 Tax=Halobellus captivus TaxID=2592614 RepID=UPI0011A86555|nr:SLC13 family permease [Halobellus captivus]
MTRTQDWWIPTPSALSVPLAIVGAVAVYLAAPFDPAGATMLAITTLCIVLWVGNLITPAYTGVLALGLIGFAFSLDLALTGFQSPATWLIAFGLVMGEATRRSGLAEWGGRWVIHRTTLDSPSKTPKRTYRRLLVGLSVAGLLLVLVIPVGIVRVLVLAPIVLEVGDRFDSQRVKLGLFFGPILVTYLGAYAILTGGSPNIIVLGILESVAGMSIAWTEWFVLMFPVMGLGRLVLIVGIVYAMYRPPDRLQMASASGELPPMAGSERRMLVFLAAGVAVWVTDAIHGFHPVFGALLVVVLVFLPRVGIADFEETVGDVDFSILFFVAAVLAIGEGLTQTNVAGALAEQLLALVPTDASLFVILSIVFVSTVVLMVVMGGLAAVSVATPIVVAVASDAGAPLVPMVLATSAALSVPFIPYQSAVLVVILAYDIVDATELIRVVSAIALATVLLLIPLQLGILAIFG